MFIWKVYALFYSRIPAVTRSQDEEQNKCHGITVPLVRKASGQYRSIALQHMVDYLTVLNMREKSSKSTSPQ